MGEGAGPPGLGTHSVPASHQRKPTTENQEDGALHLPPLTNQPWRPGNDGPLPLLMRPSGPAHGLPKAKCRFQAPSATQGSAWGSRGQGQSSPSTWPCQFLPCRCCPSLQLPPVPPLCPIQPTLISGKKNQDPRRTGTAYTRRRCLGHRGNSPPLASRLSGGSVLWGASWGSGIWVSARASCSLQNMQGRKGSGLRGGRHGGPAGPLGTSAVWPHLRPHPPDAQDSSRGASHWGDEEGDRRQGRGGCKARCPRGPAGLGRHTLQRQKWGLCLYCSGFLRM